VYRGGLTDLINRSSAWMFMWARGQDTEKRKHHVDTFNHVLAVTAAKSEFLVTRSHAVRGKKAWMFWSYTIVSL
jgi:hypothetical protein